MKEVIPDIGVHSSDEAYQKICQLQKERDELKAHASSLCVSGLITRLGEAEQRNAALVEAKHIQDVNVNHLTLEALVLSQRVLDAESALNSIRAIVLQIRPAHYKNSEFFEATEMYHRKYKTIDSATCVSESAKSESQSDLRLKSETQSHIPTAVFSSKLIDMTSSETSTENLNISSQDAGEKIVNDEKTSSRDEDKSCETCERNHKSREAVVCMKCRYMYEIASVKAFWQPKSEGGI